MYSSKVFVFLVLFQVMDHVVVGNKNDHDDVEEMLEHALFPHGENNHRPVDDRSKPLKIHLGLALRQIIEINDVSQVLKTNVWLRIYWKSNDLKWNPTNYSGIRAINIWPTKIWKPDLVLYDSADDTRSANLEKLLDTRIKLDYEGNIRWLAPYIFRSQCKINIRYFPFDSQECKMEFGSWTYDGTMMDLQLRENAADLTHFITNGEWILHDLEAVQHANNYSCCSEPWPTVIFTLRLQRRTLYYIYNLVLPCILITLLSFLSFWLPPDSGERVGLVMTVLLSMAVFLLLVAESIPSTSENVPLIGHFFIAIMFEVGLSLVCTCFLLQVHHSANRKPMSEKLRKFIFGIAARLVCYKSTHVRECAFVPSKTETVELNQRKTQNGHALNGGRVMANAHVINTELPQEMLAPSPTSRPENAVKTVNFAEGKEMLQCLRVLSDSVKLNNREDGFIAEWKEAGEIIDRMLFILFLFILFVTCATLFSMIPTFVT